MLLGKHILTVALILVVIPNSLDLNAQTPNRKEKKRSFFARQKDKQVINAAKDPFSGKEKRSKSRKNKSNTSSDAFSSKTKIEEYGSKSQGNKVRRSRKKDNGGAVSSGNFTASNNHTTDYGNKAHGKRVRKNATRKQRKSSAEPDAFTSSVRLNKNSPSAQKKNKKAGNNFKKKRGMFRLMPKEEKAYAKQSRSENARFATTKKQKKFMKKQRRKKEEGLGLPQR